MSHVKRTQFGFPARNPRRRQTMTPIFRPTLGVHAGDVPQDLTPGFTPASRNFVTDDGYLTPRSGLSSFGNYSFEDPVLGAAELFDVGGDLSVVASSRSTIAFLHPSTDSWSELSYIRDTVVLGSDDLPSGISRDYWSISPVYSLNDDDFLAVLSNGTNWMKFFTVDSGTTTYSDFTFTNDLASTKAAKAVSVVNDRLVLFNSINSVSTKFPTRVLWSARGQPKDFTIAAGAGFEDLMEMRGQGQAAVRYANVLVLFSDQETWLATPTLDAYAFRFDKLSDKIGCPYPRTAKATPIGVMWLSRDLEVYVTDGNSVMPVGPIQPGEPSRIQQILQDEFIEGDRAWAVYNSVARRYELYYSANDSVEGYPTRALYYNIDDRSWLQQRFSHELSIGADFEDPGALVTWGSMTEQWGDVLQGWGGLGTGEDRRDIATFGSAGTSYRLISTQPDDDGTTIDARWRSHGLNQRDQMRQASLYEIWMDYEAASNSSASFYVSGDLGASFDDGTAVNLKTTEFDVFVPVFKTSQSPMFELRIADGTKPKIARFQASLRDAGRFSGRL